MLEQTNRGLLVRPDVGPNQRDEVCLLVNVVRGAQVVGNRRKVVKD